MKEIQTPEGIRFQFPDPKDHIAKYMIRKKDWYERDLLEDIRKRTVPGQVAIDVGAHIGNHSLWMAVVCGMRVWAFEPNPDAREQLVRNVSLNPHGLVKIMPYALGTQWGVGAIMKPKAGNSGANYISTDVIDVADCSIAPLDVFPFQERVGLIKIDVEGMEPEVLKGAQRTINRWKPLIYAEAKTREARDAIEDELPNGYECFGKFAITPVYGYAHP